MELGGIIITPGSESFIILGGNKSRRPAGNPSIEWNYDYIRPEVYQPIDIGPVRGPARQTSLRDHIISLLAARRLGPQQEEILPADLRAEIGRMREMMLGIKLYGETIEPLRMYTIDEPIKFMHGVIGKCEPRPLHITSLHTALDDISNYINLNSYRFTGMQSIGFVWRNSPQCNDPNRFIVLYRGEYYILWMSGMTCSFTYKIGLTKIRHACRIIMHDPEYVHVRQIATNPYIDLLTDKRFRQYCCGLMSRPVGSSPFILCRNDTALKKYIGRRRARRVILVALESTSGIDLCGGDATGDIDKNIVQIIIAPGEMYNHISYNFFILALSNRLPEHIGIYLNTTPVHDR